MINVIHIIGTKSTALKRVKLMYSPQLNLYIRPMLSHFTANNDSINHYNYWDDELFMLFFLSCFYQIL